MFEAAELGSTIEKKDYERELPKIRAALLQAQWQLARSKHSCLILVGGAAAAGKGELVDTLLAWMDPRGIRVHTFFSRTEEEKRYPPFWRFWRALPAAGRTAIFYGSWYTKPIADRVYGRIHDSQLDRELRRIAELEQMLANDNVLLIKVWLHLSRKAQKKNIERMEKDPQGRAQLSPRELRDARHYPKMRAVAEHALRISSTGQNPWLIVDSEDSRGRNVAVARAVTRALEERQKSETRVHKSPPRPALPVPAKKNLLSSLDLSRSLSEAEAESKQRALQLRLVHASRCLSRSKRSAILLFEGPDAAGKGGAIRRLTAAMDARLYQVRSVAAPSEEERAHPYLWRFWRDLPHAARMTIYDRSWYGRVLVERIEGFAAPEQWQRAYAEINSFEEELVSAGAILIKFWLAVSPEEQLKRFKDRENTPYKQYKLTAEDWRNRDKWAAYEAAACEMFEKTSTESAHWKIIAANDKKWARVQVLKHAVTALEQALGL